VGIEGIEDLKFYPTEGDSVSSTDPDLRPQEANKPIAIDVVDGNLIIKRYDGSEESVPMGGSTTLTTVSDEDWLEWCPGSTAQASGTVYESQGPGPGTTLYDNTFMSVVDVAPEDVPQDGTGLVVGDNFVLSGSYLYFREPGIYMATINGTPSGFSGGDWGYRIYTNVTGRNYSIKKNVIPADADYGGDDQFVFTVFPDVTLHNSDEELWVPGDVISSSSQAILVDAWQNSGVPQDLAFDIYVVRISG
jgi:hypothetical protein